MGCSSLTGSKRVGHDIAMQPKKKKQEKFQDYDCGDSYILL